jgi:hypothetical protein
MNYCSFLIIVVLPCLVLAGEPSVPDHREYRLDVSFEVPRSKIAGSVKVPVRAGREMAFTIGHLSVGPYP